jgi:hypothetical protein
MLKAAAENPVNMPFLAVEITPKSRTPSNELSEKMAPTQPPHGLLEPLVAMWLEISSIVSTLI